MKDVQNLLIACVTVLTAWQAEEYGSENYLVACECRDQILDSLDKAKEPVDASRDMKTECHSCANKATVPGNCHIRCSNPDQYMTGNQHGINHGWFFYPMLFDPVWKTRLCNNYVPLKKVAR